MLINPKQRVFTIVINGVDPGDFMIQGILYTIYKVEYKTKANFERLM